MGDVAIGDESKTRMSWLETVFGLLCDDKSRRQLLCSGKRSLMMQRVNKELRQLLRAGHWPVYVHVKEPREIRRIIMMEHEAEDRARRLLLSDDDSEDDVSDDDSDDDKPLALRLRVSDDDSEDDMSDDDSDDDKPLALRLRVSDDGSKDEMDVLHDDYLLSGDEMLSDDDAEDDMLPSRVEEAWLYVLHALEQLGTRTQITGLDLSAMGPSRGTHLVSSEFLVLSTYELRDVLVPLVEAHSKWLEVLNLNGIEMCLPLYDLFVVDRLRERERAPLGPLAKCTSLTHLDLSGPFGVGDHGMRYFVRVLPELTSLRTLIVRNCGLQAAGAKALAGALDECPSVSLVDVSGNDLTTEGREALAAAFRKRDASHQLITPAIS
jgi:hypothetical protein